VPSRWLSPSSAATPGGKDDVYATFVEEILDGTLAPGRRSRSAPSSNASISRTPIRQVLWRLERDDLVEIHPHRGAFVKKMGADDVGDLFQLREALEPLASALAAQRRPEDELVARSLRAFASSRSAEDASASRLVQLGGDLHDAIVRWSGNRMLLRIYGRSTCRRTSCATSCTDRSAPSGCRSGSTWPSSTPSSVGTRRRRTDTCQPTCGARGTAVLEHLFGEVPGPEAARAPNGRSACRR
jgi:DNA-binding GntR family transcriptional regulator